VRLLLYVYLLAHIPLLGVKLITIIYTTMIKLVSALHIKDTNRNIKCTLKINFNWYINSCHFLGTQHNLSVSFYVGE
jgi:hypothetical protein